MAPRSGGARSSEGDVMQCPRCHADLVVEREYHGIDVDRCPSCEGRWLDPDELDQLEATVPSTPEERRATVKYAERKSELACPKCGKTMTAFNYRAYNLQLDGCGDGAAWWRSPSGSSTASARLTVCPT